ncbi:MAG: laccase domain-containing protein, partial [Candidatus Aminicenantes bacterium]|nr:laccase domain-containing protein [Candidatus Aminicenantes bacterium]
SGIREQNIFSIDLCTHCEKYLLSFRRDKNNTGRMLSYIGISF